MRTAKIQLIVALLALSALMACKHQERELLAAPVDVTTDAPLELVVPDSVRLRGLATLCVWPEASAEPVAEQGAGDTLRPSRPAEGATLLHVAAIYKDGQIVDLERHWVEQDSAGVRICYDATPEDTLPARDTVQVLRALSLRASSRPVRLTRIRWETDSATTREERAESFQITPAEWDRIADRNAPCALGTASAGTAAYVTWTLSAPQGGRLSLPLPATLREVVSPVRGERHWMGRDSSRLEMQVASDPQGGLAAGGPARIEDEGACALPVAGHRALVHRLRLVDTLSKRVDYMAAATGFVRPGIAFSASVESRHTESRDAILRALGAMTVQGTIGTRSRRPR